MSDAGSFYPRPSEFQRTLLADVLLLGADVVLDATVLGIFLGQRRLWVLSLNAIGIILNVLNMLVEGISFHMLAAVAECMRRGEYTPTFLRILLSETMYEAGAASLVQCYALVEVDGLGWPSSLALLASGLLSLGSLAKGRMICGIDLAHAEGPFALRAFTMMPGYHLAFCMRLAEITFRITSMAILMTALHPAMAAMLLIDIAVVAWAYFLGSGDLTDTICFIVTGAPLLLLSWQGGAVFGRHALDGRVWYAVTLARVCLPFAYLADTCGDRFAARFPVGRLLAANVELASDPPAFCRVFMLALCVLSGLTLYGIVFYLCCFTSKLHARDIEAERQHRIMAARLKTDFEAAYDEHHRAMTDESRQNLEF